MTAERHAGQPIEAIFPHLAGRELPRLTKVGDYDLGSLDVVFGCLRQVIPARVPAEGTSCLWNLNVRGQTKGGEGGKYGFSMAITSNGGTGARPDKDGLSATAYPSGVRGTPVEIAETQTPLIFWRKEFRPDSGGAGRTRFGDARAPRHGAEQRPVAHGAGAGEAREDGAPRQSHVASGAGEHDAVGGRRSRVLAGGWRDAHDHAARARGQQSGESGLHDTTLEHARRGGQPGRPAPVRRRGLSACDTTFGT